MSNAKGLGRTWVVALVVAMALTGCTVGGDSDDPATSSPPTTDPPPSSPVTEAPGTTAPTSSSDDSSAAAQAPPELPDVPIAVVPTSVANLELEIYALTRVEQGGAVYLAFALHNTGTEEFQVATALGAGVGSFQVDAISLVDVTGLKRYLTLTSADGTCVCSSLTQNVFVQPAGRSFLYAVFAEPPADVTRMVVDTPIASVPDVPLVDG